MRVVGAELKELERHSMKPAGFFLAIGGFVADQIVTPDISESFLRYAVTQGGLLVVVIVLAWSYRRDFSKILETKTDQIVVLTNLVATSSAAGAKHAEALVQASNSIALQQATLQSMTTEISKLIILTSGRRGQDRHERD